MGVSFWKVKMKNYIEEPANIKSVSELAARLESGEVFYLGVSKIWFDSSRINPFRFDDGELNGCWSRFLELTTRRECNWWEVEGALPALCVVSDSPIEGDIADQGIAIVAGVTSRGAFETSEECWWECARPATMEELKQYIKA